MSGMEPLLIGAALGGASSAAMGKNPIQGALLGGLGGGVLGAASGMAGAANAATAGASAAEAIAAQPALSYAGGQIAQAAPATFGQTIANIPSAISQGAMNNPNMAMSGLSAAQGLMAPEQQQPMPQAGPVTRPQARSPVDFMSLLNPQQGQQRPQPISLI